MVAFNFKERFVPKIEKGLGIANAFPDVHPKTHTVRARGKRRPPRPHEELQLFTGQRTNKCRLIGRARCTKVEPIIIWCGVEPGYMAVKIAKQTVEDIDTLSRDDGFKDRTDMWRFFRDTSAGANLPNIFEGFIIYWEPL